MNDYYRSYRPGNNRFEKNYRGYNSHQNKGHDSINGNARKSENEEQGAPSEPIAKLLVDILPVVKTFLSTYGEIQKRMAEMNELSMITEKIKVKALLNIARDLKRILSSEEDANKQDETDSFTLMENELGEVLKSLEASGPAVVPSERGDQEKSTAEAEDIKNNRVQKESKTPLSDTDTKQMLILKIAALREEGLHFEQIAEHFTSEGIPTLSGKGKWHASTVSNLLKREIQA